MRRTDIYMQTTYIDMLSTCQITSYTCYTIKQKCGRLAAPPAAAQLGEWDAFMYTVTVLAVPVAISSKLVEDLTLRDIDEVE
jgi:hypothetical protein